MEDLFKDESKINFFAELQNRLCQLRINPSKEFAMQIINQIPVNLLSQKEDLKIICVLFAYYAQISTKMMQKYVIILFEQIFDYMNKYLQDESDFIWNIFGNFIYFKYWMFEKGLISIQFIMHKSLSNGNINDYFISDICEKNHEMFEQEFNGNSYSLYKLQTFRKLRQNYFKWILESGDFNDELYKNISIDSDQLLFAIKTDDIDTFIKIITDSKIELSKNINSNNYEEKCCISILSWAAKYNSMKICKYLISNDVEIDKDALFQFILWNNKEMINISKSKMKSFEQYFLIYSIKTWNFECLNSSLNNFNYNYIKQNDISIENNDNILKIIKITFNSKNFSFFKTTLLPLLKNNSQFMINNIHKIIFYSLSDESCFFLKEFLKYPEININYHIDNVSFLRKSIKLDNTNAVEILLSKNEIDINNLSENKHHFCIACQSFANMKIIKLISNHRDFNIFTINHDKLICLYLYKNFYAIQYIFNNFPDLKFENIPYSMMTSLLMSKRLASLRIILKYFMNINESNAGLIIKYFENNCKYKTKSLELFKKIISQLQVTKQVESEFSNNNNNTEFSNNNNTEFRNNNNTEFSNNNNTELFGNNNTVYDFNQNDGEINPYDFEVINLSDKSNRFYYYIFTVKAKNTGEIFSAQQYNRKSYYFNSIFVFKELQIQKILNYPSILHFFGFSEKNNLNEKNPIIITEYALNGRLNIFLEKSKCSLTFVNKIIIIYGIASGMKLLHSLNISHNNLQLSSIFLDEFLHPKISDFCYSNNRIPYLREDFYKDPVNFDGNKNSKASDVYSFSMLAYQILTNKKPFDLNNSRSLKNEIIINNVRPFIPDSVPKCISDLIILCWSKDPEKRPQFSEIVFLIRKNISSILNQSDLSEFNKYDYILKLHNKKQIITNLSNISTKEEEEDFQNCFSFLNIARFKILKTIGKGRLSTVYKVHDDYTNRIFAAKKFKKNVDFKNELDIITKTNHKSIVKFYGYSDIDFTQNHNPILFLEYESNGSLNDILDTKKDILLKNGWDETKKLINIYGIASAMEYLHSINILHLDLKPSNVLEDDYLFPRICDFNLSKPVDLNVQDQLNEDPLGTPLYMAPEVIKEKKYSKASDVFSFGMMMYEIITGIKPFNGIDTDYQILDQIAKGERPQFENEISNVYRKLIEMCWSQDIQKRPNFKEIVKYLKKNSSFLDDVDNDKFLNYVLYIENKVSLDELTLKNVFEKYIITKEECSKNFSIPFSIYRIELEKYDKKNKIGEGNFGKVYKIVNKETNEILAAKILKNVSSFSQHDITYISREVNILANLDHYSIAKFVGFSETNFKNQLQPVIITEIYENGSLKNILELKRRGINVPKWNNTKKFIVIYGIASGMKYMHSKHFIHRDLKPENILVDDFLFPIITDFGLSKYLTYKKAKNLSGFIGTPIYAAPEVFSCCDYTESCDVYSFSLILYEIITNEKPFKDIPNIYQLINEVCVNKKRPQFNCKIPKCYRKLIEKCWDHDPKKRPSFIEIIDMLNTDQNFIFHDSNIDEIIYYTKIIGEKFTESNLMIRNYLKKKDKMKPLKNKNIFQNKNIVDIEKTFITNSIFQETMNIVKSYHRFYGCFDLKNFLISDKTINKNSIEVVHKDTHEKYYATNINIDMTYFSQVDIQNFSEEFNIITKLDHLSIVKIIGFNLFNFVGKLKPIIITESFNKCNLSSVIEGKMSQINKMIVIYGIASGMNYLHSLNILHSNLNPSNIYLNSSYHPKLFNYWLLMNDTNAKTLTLQSTKALNHIFSFYSAPEIFKYGKYQKASDVYSFSMIVYEIITGKKPFYYLNNFQNIYKEIFINGKRPEFPENISLCYKKLIERCWSQEPSDRLTFEEILDILKFDSSFILSEFRSKEFFEYVDQIDNYQARYPFKKKINELDINHSENKNYSLEHFKEIIPFMNNYKVKLSIFPMKKFLNLPNKCKFLVEETEKTQDKNQLFLIGRSLIEGLDVFPIDVETGIKYLMESINKGNIDSIVYYCKLLIKGNFILRNLKKARNIISTKFESQIGLSEFLKGKIFNKENNYEEAMKCFMKSIEAEYIESLYEYAKMILKGRILTQNNEIGIDYYIKSIEMHNYKAMFRYGMMLIKGENIKRNVEEGINYIKKSSNLGYPKALYQYYLILKKEVGSISVINESFEYLKKSAYAGHIESMHEYGVLLLKCGRINESKIFLQKSSDRGIIDSMYYYAKIINNKDSIKYFKIAANLGHKKAKKCLEKQLKNTNQE